MLKEFIKSVQKELSFEVPIYDGLVILKGRVLSPTEAESASIASTLLISQVAKVGGDSNDLRDLSEKLSGDDVSEETLNKAFSFLSKISPADLTKIADTQNRVLCQVINKASMDKGETWEKITIVMSEDQQLPDQNRLWVGALSSEDRTLLLNQAMQGHREAVERLATFPR
mgnify:FL=1